MDEIKSFIVYRGKKYYSEEDILELNGNENLHRNEIEDMAEIQGLSKLIHLKRLYLCSNKILEIKGLENLSN